MHNNLWQKSRRTWQSDKPPVLIFNRKGYQNIFLSIFIIVIFVLFAPGVTLHANNFLWVGGSNSWTTQLSNWHDLSLQGNQIATHFPSLTDDVAINTGVVSLESNGSANTLVVKSTLSILGGGNLTSTSTERIGSSGSSLGSIVQTGGTNAPASLNISNGSYTLSGGDLSTNQVTLFPPTQSGVTNISNFIQTGGVHTTGYLTVYASANYTMSAGILNVNSGLSSGYTQVSGNFIQSGGTHTISACPCNSLSFMVDSGGSYLLSGGSLITDSESIGWYSRSGIFTQTGGTNATQILAVGSSLNTIGTYNLSDTGSLNVTEVEYVGLNGTGIFNQSSGSHEVLDLRIGYFSGGVGTYTLSDTGSLIVTGNEYIGGSGSGVFTQTGGTNTVSNGTVSLASIGGSGTYNLQGGSLNTKMLVVNKGVTFNLEGAAPSTTLSAQSLTNSGTFSVRGNSVVSSGSVPAHAAAFTQTAAVPGTEATGGTLTIQIDGSGDGQFGQLIVGSASLAGKLMVTLGGAGPPKNSDSFVILSAGSRTGTFNNGQTYVEARNSTDNKVAGIFDVSYANNSVTLSHFRRIHVLSFGVTDVSDKSINGNVAAERVSNAFKGLPGVINNVLDKRLAFNWTSNAANVWALKNDIANIPVQDGDTFVMFVNAHGGFDKTNFSGAEGPLIREVGQNKDTKTQRFTPIFMTQATRSKTFLSLSGALTDISLETISAADFSNLFSGTKWVNVNKLFVMDTCYANGFWQGAGGISHLAGLPHSAIIASSPENLMSYGTELDGGDLGNAFAKIIKAQGVGVLSDFSLLKTKVFERKGLDDSFTANENRYVEGWSGDGYGVPLGAELVNTVSGNASAGFVTGFVSGPNVKLTALTLSVGTLIPAFAGDTTAYSANVSAATSSLTLTSTLADTNATLKVNGTAVNSGAASGSIPLANGTNVITIITTGVDGSATKTYMVTVTRGAFPSIGVQQPVGVSLGSGSTNINFGALTAGATYSTSFLINNTGTTALTLGALTIDGANSTDFTVTSSPASSVAAGGSSTFTVMFAPTAAGARSATLHIPSNDTQQTPFNIALTGTLMTSSESWRAKYFGTSSNSGDAADVATPSHDGIPNLLKFATNADPTQSGVMPGTAIKAGGNLEFTYPRSKAAMSEGILFAVQWSDDLTALNWTSTEVNESVLNEDTFVQQIKATVPAGTNGRRFVRLKVTRP